MLPCCPNNNLADKYQTAHAIWNEQFGSYATLIRFNKSITGLSQSQQQLDSLISCLSDAKKLQQLYLIDTGVSALNAKIKRFISDAFFRFEHRQHQKLSAERAKNAELAKAEALRKQADEQKSANLLAELELKEKLLAHEGEFKTLKKAKLSTLIKQAKQLKDIQPVFSKKPYWHGTNEYDERGERQGHFTYTWLLTFEMI